MLIKKPVGISSYGVAIPRSIILSEIIEQAQGKAGTGCGLALRVKSKTVPAIDEDTITLATQAASQALANYSGKATDIGAVFIGSESHPYAVKPSGTVVKSVLGLSEELAVADLQFACKAATQGWQIGASYVLSGLARAALIIGADTAQSRPGDVLEFTAGAGAGAYIWGSQNLLAELRATISIATDTPDFWRRAGQSFPEHAGRFSGEPAYFYHIITAAEKIMAETGLKPSDFAACVFHTPNGKFPRLVAEKLGFSSQQLEPSLIVETVGNTYAAAVPLALSAVLDQAQRGEKILVVSYGSGSGSDAFVFETTAQLPIFNRHRSTQIRSQIERATPVDYQTYFAITKLLTT